MRYYDLDENSWPLADYARPQPDKDLRHLPERQSEHERWDEDRGTWVEDAASVAADWLARIATERERRLSTRIPVTLSDGEFVIPVSDRAAALAPNAEKRARRKGSTVPFPTDKGIIDFDADDLARIEDAIGDYMVGVFHREQELQQKVARGTISEIDLEKGWPS